MENNNSNLQPSPFKEMLHPKNVFETLETSFPKNCYKIERPGSLSLAHFAACKQQYLTLSDREKKELGKLQNVASVSVPLPCGMLTALSSMECSEDAAYLYECWVWRGLTYDFTHTPYWLTRTSFEFLKQHFIIKTLDIFCR